MQDGSKAKYGAIKNVWYTDVTVLMCYFHVIENCKKTESLSQNHFFRVDGNTIRFDSFDQFGASLRTLNSYIIFLNDSSQ